MNLFYKLRVKIYLIIPLLIILFTKVNAQNTLPATGNVGIGTTSPTEKLDVRGNIRLGGQSTGNYIYTLGDYNSPVFKTTRSDLTHPGTFSTDGWGNFSIDRSFGIGYLVGRDMGTGNLYVAGKTGLGTAEPTSTLDVRGNVRIGDDNVGNYIYTVRDYSFPIFKTSRTDLTAPGTISTDGWGNFSMDRSFGIGYVPGKNMGAGNLYAAGRIGIGTAEPTSSLDIRGNIRLGADNAGNYIYAVSNTSFPVFKTTRTDLTRPGILSTDGMGNFSFSESLNVKYNLLVTNKVGLGTDDPTEKLDVRGNIRLGGDDAGNYIFTIANTNLPIIKSSRTDLTHPGLLSADGWGNFSVNHSFGIGYQLGRDNMDNSNLFVAGRVGIGTDDPKGYSLAVKGNVIAESVTVKTSSTWPDYVFGKSYVLMPLSEIEDYIRNNQHLPEMPSAAVIQTDGINLGEINILLTKKIEELTLHLIAKDKEIKNQEKVNIDQLNNNERLQSQINDLNTKLNLVLKKLE